MLFVLNKSSMVMLTCLLFLFAAILLPSTADAHCKPKIIYKKIRVPYPVIKKVPVYKEVKVPVYIKKHKHHDEHHHMGHGGEHFGGQGYNGF